MPQPAGHVYPFAPSPAPFGFDSVLLLPADLIDSPFQVDGRVKRDDERGHGKRGRAANERLNELKELNTLSKKNVSAHRNLSGPRKTLMDSSVGLQGCFCGTQ